MRLELLGLLAAGCIQVPEEWEPPNSPPGEPVVNMWPEDPRTNDDLHVFILEDAVDEDGDAVAYSYVWSVDGEVVVEVVDAVVPAASTARGQTWTVVVTATDGEDEGGRGEGAIVVVNTPPVALSGRFDPPDPGPNDPIQVIVDYDDPDGDVIEPFYAWTVDGAETGWDVDTIPATSTASGQTWEVVVTYHDQIELGEPISGDVTVR